MRNTFNPFYTLRNQAADDGTGGAGDAGGNGDAGGGTGAAGDTLSILNPDLTFADGYQDKVGEFANGLSFKNLPDVFKSVKEGTATITRLNQEKAQLAKQLQDLSAGSAPPQLPADTAGYKAALKLPEQLPEGVHVPDDLLDAASKYALENQIPPEVTNKFIAFQIEQAAKEFSTFRDAEFAAVERAKAEISSTVGPENYEVTVANAKAAHDLLGLNLTQNDLIQNPTLVTSLAKIHAKLAPGTLRELGIGKEGMTAESKLQQANDILTNESNPHYTAFHDHSHVNHKAALDHYNRLILESGGGN